MCWDSMWSTSVGMGRLAGLLGLVICPHLCIAYISNVSAALWRCGKYALLITQLACSDADHR